MREAKVEIDRLNAEVSVLQGFIASMIKGLSVELPETMELVQAEFDNLYSDSGSQTDREAIESVLDDPKAPWNHDPTCPLHRVEDGECTCADIPVEYMTRSAAIGQIDNVIVRWRSLSRKDRNPMFKITGKKGFHITFANGYTVSVQFGPGNYCDNYDRRIGRDEESSGSDGSSAAECGVWGPNNGELLMLPDFMESGDTVSNRSTPAQVLQLLNWAASDHDADGKGQADA